MFSVVGLCTSGLLQQQQQRPLAAFWSAALTPRNDDVSSASPEAASTVESKKRSASETDSGMTDDSRPICRDDVILWATTSKNADLERRLTADDSESDSDDVKIDVVTSRPCSPSNNDVAGAERRSDVTSISSGCVTSSTADDSSPTKQLKFGIDRILTNNRLTSPGSPLRPSNVTSNSRSHHDLLLAVDTWAAAAAAAAARGTTSFLPPFTTSSTCPASVAHMFMHSSISPAGSPHGRSLQPGGPSPPGAMTSLRFSAHGVTMALPQPTPIRQHHTGPPLPFTVHHSTRHDLQTGYSLFSSHGPPVSLRLQQSQQSSCSSSQSKKKRSWSRAVFSNLQRKGLEKRFEVQKYVTKPDRRQLAAMLGLTDAQVKVWFQNRRMKWRHQEEAKKSSKEEEGRRQTAAAAANKPPQQQRHVTDDVRAHQRDVITASDDVDNFTSDDDSDDVTDDAPRHVIVAADSLATSVGGDGCRSLQLQTGSNDMSPPRMRAFRKPASIMSVADILDLRVSIDYSMTSSSDVTKIMENGIKFSPVRLA